MTFAKHLPDSFCVVFPADRNIRSWFLANQSWLILNGTNNQY
jgi:hypothetical protein